MTDRPASPVEGSTLELLAADREFAAAIPEADRPAAKRALTLPCVCVGRGDPVVPEQDASAMVLVEGAVWREIVVGRSAAPQVLHPGAVLLSEPPAGELLQTASQAAALMPSRLAVLDRRFLLAAARWPGLAAVAHRRLAEQERDLAVAVAIGGLPRVDDRLLLLLWHFAERWGAVVPGGIRLSLSLTHATLGRFVGARRPTVSLAIAELRERGELDRDPSGAWLLTGSPPAVAEAPAAMRMPDLFPQERRPITRDDAAA